jgi:hypothetical protein
VTDLGSQLVDFLDTAAVMMNLDLVITADTATAHLAGALGVPVWVALPFAPDWRWLLRREDSPWYPTLRLFRQAQPGDWDGVFERMASELRKLVGTTERTPIPHPSSLIPSEVGTTDRRPSIKTPWITVEISPGELIDRITLLEIQSERLTDATELSHLGVELAALRAAHQQALPPTEDFRALTTELRAVHEQLWQVEAEIRRCEQNADFGPRFLELARSFFQKQDRRTALRRRINERLGFE